MTAEAPALIQYACERCKTRFVLPTSERKLGVSARFKALFSSLGRVFKKHEGFGTAYDATKRQMLAKMDDEAYQAFVQSFRFCHECRQFVCNECWSTSRKACLTCVAKSMAGEVKPRPPFEAPAPAIKAAPMPRAKRKIGWRRQATALALIVAIALLGLEAFTLITYHNGGPAAADAATATPGLTPSPSPGDTNQTPTPVALPGSGTPVTSSPTITASPTPTPTLSPPLPDPQLACAKASNHCTIRNYSSYPGAQAHWSENGVSIYVGPAWSWTFHNPGRRVAVYVSAPNYSDSIAETWTEGSNETPRPTLTPTPTPRPTPTPSPTPTPTNGPTPTGPTPSPTPAPSPTPMPILTVTAHGPSTIVYGSAVPTITVTYSPQAPQTLPYCSTSYTQGTSHSGSTFGFFCNGADDPDFTIQYVNGSMLVTDRHITINPDDVTISSGDTPNFTYSLSGDGLYQGDDWSSGPSCSAPDWNGSDTGTFAITCTGSVDSDYTISSTSGTLTVN